MAHNLTTDKQVDTHLKPLKSGEVTTSLELSTQDNGAKVTGDLEVTGVIRSTSGHLILPNIVIDDPDANIKANGNFTFTTTGNLVFRSDTAIGRVQFKDDSGNVCVDVVMNEASSYNYLAVSRGGGGADGLTLYSDATNQVISAQGTLEIASAGVLEIDAGGQVSVTGQDMSVDATKAIYLDGGGDTYIVEAGADAIRIVVGGDQMLNMTETSDGNLAHFRDACVGFDQLEPTYDATNTVVEFRKGNKQNLTFGAGNIVNLNIHFPDASGNFILLIKQDGTGSRLIANYKVFTYDGNSAGTSSVKFAGGSNPTLTTDANHVDILSFYWDNDNEIAYGVPTLDFQF